MVAEKINPRSPNTPRPRVLAPAGVLMCLRTLSESCHRAKPPLGPQVLVHLITHLVFSLVSAGSVVKSRPAIQETACSTGDLGSITGSGRSPGEGNGNPLQHSCLGNPMDRGSQGATVPGIAKSRTQLSVHTRWHRISCFLPMCPLHSSHQAICRSLSVPCSF